MSDLPSAERCPACGLVTRVWRREVIRESSTEARTGHCVVYYHVDASSQRLVRRVCVYNHKADAVVVIVEAVGGSDSHPAALKAFTEPLDEDDEAVEESVAREAQTEFLQRHSEAVTRTGSMRIPEEDA